MRREDFRFVPIRFTRSGMNLVKEAGTIRDIVRLLRTVEFDLIHNVTIKPVLYGSLATRIVNPTPTINAISGMGYVFLAKGWRGGISRALIKPLYRFALSGSRSRVIFQNPDDIDTFISSGMVDKKNIALIRGSGVDVGKFVPGPEPQGIPVVMLASRLLKDKGVVELVEAARLLRDWNVPCRTVLVGDPDSDNPATVTEGDLLAWVEEGIIEWWGYKSDMERILPQATIVVLPSYREGLPKVLLEAASAGRPIVTTNVPGCRETVREGWNGILVPPRDHIRLAEAIRHLLENPDLRASMGMNGREMAITEFRIENVVASTLDVYANLLGEKFRSGTKNGPV